MSNVQRTVVYTDGSCLHNGFPNAIAGAGVYFGDHDPRNVSCDVPGAQTNNRGEVWAIIQAMNQCDSTVPLEIRSDSRWAIQCATGQWKAKENLDLLQQLWDLLQTRDVIFTWVKGHSKEPGNEAADELARKGCCVTRV